jgi:hypothetical protein
MVRKKLLRVNKRDGDLIVLSYHLYHVITLKRLRQDAFIGLLLAGDADAQKAYELAMQKYRGKQ